MMHLEPTLQPQKRRTIGNTAMMMTMTVMASSLLPSTNLVGLPTVQGFSYTSTSLHHRPSQVRLSSTEAAGEFQEGRVTSPSNVPLPSLAVAQEMDEGDASNNQDEGDASIDESTMLSVDSGKDNENKGDDNESDQAAKVAGYDMLATRGQAANVTGYDVLATHPTDTVEDPTDTLEEMVMGAMSALVSGGPLRQTPPNLNGNVPSLNVLGAHSTDTQQEAYRYPPAVHPRRIKVDMDAILLGGPLGPTPANINGHFPSLKTLGAHSTDTIQETYPTVVHPTRPKGSGPVSTLLLGGPLGQTPANINGHLPTETPFGMTIATELHEQPLLLTQEMTDASKVPEAKEAVLPESLEAENETTRYALLENLEAENETAGYDVLAEHPSE